MDAATQKFIEKMGLIFETDGMPRIAGRVLGLLLLSPEALSLDDLSELLRVSKASASTNARLLERMGALERVAKPGDRRDYYHVDAAASERMLEVRLERLVRLHGLVAEGLETVPFESPEVRARLEWLEVFHGQVVEQLRRSLVRWRTRRESESAGQRPRAAAG